MSEVYVVAERTCSGIGLNVTDDGEITVIALVLGGDGEAITVLGAVSGASVCVISVEVTNVRGYDGINNLATEATGVCNSTVVIVTCGVHTRTFNYTGHSYGVGTAVNMSGVAVVVVSVG